jgi:hypothetical protein
VPGEFAAGETTAKRRQTNQQYELCLIHSDQIAQREKLGGYRPAGAGR